MEEKSQKMLTKMSMTSGSTLLATFLISPLSSVTTEQHEECPPNFESHLCLNMVYVDIGEENNQTYRLAGQMLVSCLIEAGVCPHFFSLRLFRQIHGLPPLALPIEEVADPKLQSKLIKIASAATLEEVREAIGAAETELSMMGAHYYPNSMDQRDELMTDFLEFYTERHLSGPLEKFRKDLKEHGLLDEMITHQNEFAELFSKCDIQLRPAKLLLRFKPPSTSDIRGQESRAIGSWQNWLLEVKDETGFMLSKTTKTVESMYLFASKYVKEIIRRLMNSKPAIADLPL